MINDFNYWVIKIRSAYSMHLVSYLTSILVVFKI